METSYTDSVPLSDGAVSDDGTYVHAGQIWRDKKTPSRLDSLFVVTSVYERTYAGGKEPRRRVKGVLITKGYYIFCDPERTLDIESMRAMYRFIHFEPLMPEPVEDK